MSNSFKPLLPSLLPRLVDPLWHKVDEPKDENLELTKMEKEQEQKMKAITKSFSDIQPIGTCQFYFSVIFDVSFLHSGKNSQEQMEDDDEDDEDDDNDNDDNDDSDSPDDEDAEMDINFGIQASPA